MLSFVLWFLLFFFCCCFLWIFWLILIFLVIGRWCWFRCRVCCWFFRVMIWLFRLRLVVVRLWFLVLFCLVCWICVILVVRCWCCVWFVNWLIRLLRRFVGWFVLLIILRFWFFVVVFFMVCRWFCWSMVCMWWLVFWGVFRSICVRVFWFLMGLIFWFLMKLIGCLIWVFMIVLLRLLVSFLSVGRFCCFLLFIWMVLRSWWRFLCVICDRWRLSCCMLIVRLSSVFLRLIWSSVWMLWYVCFSIFGCSFVWFFVRFVSSVRNWLMYWRCSGFLFWFCMVIWSNVSVIRFWWCLLIVVVMYWWLLMWLFVGWILLFWKWWLMLSWCVIWRFIFIVLDVVVVLVRKVWFCCWWCWLRLVVCRLSRICRSSCWFGMFLVSWRLVWSYCCCWWVFCVLLVDVRIRCVLVICLVFLLVMLGCLVVWWVRLLFLIFRFLLLLSVVLFIRFLSVWVKVRLRVVCLRFVCFSVLLFCLLGLFWCVILLLGNVWCGDDVLVFVGMKFVFVRCLVWLSCLW